MSDRIACTCHDIDIATFRSACQVGARNVKTCFRTVGCMPKCSNCIPMVRSVLAEFAEPTRTAQPPASDTAAHTNVSTE